MAKVGVAHDRDDVGGADEAEAAGHGGAFDEDDEHLRDAGDPVEEPPAVAIHRRDARSVAAGEERLEALQVAAGAEDAAAPAERDAADVARVVERAEDGAELRHGLGREGVPRRRAVQPDGEPVAVAFELEGGASRKGHPRSPGAQMRATPKLFGRTVRWRASQQVSSAKPSTFRVSRGSIMP